MCGVLVAFAKEGQLNEKDCLRASEKIFSRGPDFNFSRFKLSNRLFLSQTVLSITGKPELNLEYAKSKNKRYEILFNGEIYNHKELQLNHLDKQDIYNLSGSDTETVINLHQVMDPVDVRKKIQGMFAYVVYDSHENKLLISRDIVGEKVLYHYEDENLIIISSQLGPILEIAKNIKINKNLLKKYFFTRHLLTEKETVYKNINVFQPGETLEINLKSLDKKILHLEKLSDLICEDKLKDNSKKNDNDILIEADNIMKKNAQFLNPEIDFFSVVSGGIDSTLVSKYLNDFSDKKPNYICLQFPEKDNVASEVKAFEKYLKNTIKEVNVDVDLFQNYLNESYKSICMPLPTHSFISQAILAREVNKEGIKILFTGDGGDELFGGYEFYKTINFNNSYKHNPSVYSGIYDQGVKFKDYNFDELKEINSSQWNNIFDNYQNFNSLEANIHSILLLDTKVQLESVGIRASDTMSMMSSVESRGFFLTKMILDFAINLPADKKISVKSNNIETRPLMKNLFVKQFDKSLLKPKQGFSGFPNESMKKIINNFNITREFLNIEEFEKLDIENNLALEWKFLNVEYFLNFFLNNAK
tara:strand:+ start:2018 stop:3781 length:1764 start_codon:yes stop_codon:yes gene_type:complete